MTDQTLHCPDPETLAAFAEGSLARREVSAVLAHLDVCRRCMSAVEGANAHLSERRNPRTTWLAAAAAVVLAATGVLAWQAMRSRHDDPPAARLIALAPRDARTVEARLAGGFEWAPYRGPMRANDAQQSVQAFKLAGAVGDLLERAERDPSIGVQHAAGTGLVLVERPEEALAKLRAAAKREPSNAKLWNDIGAAEYAAAIRMNEPSRYAKSLAAFDRAMALDAKFAEAAFNRALTLERLGMTTAARDAWNLYLRLDPSSPWAAEARQHLGRLPASNAQSSFRDDQPRLEAAAVAGEAARLDELVRRYPQQSRTFGETDYLGRWGEAPQDERLLTIARAIGDSLVRTNGETLLRDAVRAIDEADPPARRSLAEAHAIYKRGRIAYSRQAPAAAEPDLRRAAELFAAAKSPMALVARYYAANTRYDQGDASTARPELERLLAEADARPAYAALGAQVRWQLALALDNEDDSAGALPLLTEAETIFRRLGERANLAFVETMAGDALASLGRPEESWAAHIRSFAALDAEGRGDRLAVCISGAVRTELRQGRFEAAAALLAIEQATLRAAGNETYLVTALARGAVLAARLGDRSAAWANVREAAAAVARIADPAVRTRAQPDVDFARGAVQLGEEPREAAASLALAIEGYSQIEWSQMLPEAHLLRARALSDGEALEEIARGIAAYERHRVRFAGSVVGTGVNNAAAGLYEEAIARSLRRDDTASAFAYAERMLARITPEPPHAADLEAVRQRLAGSGAAVLELVALPEEVVSFAITEQGATAQRVPRNGSDLRALGDAVRGNDLTAARTLYDLLIRPAETSLAGASHLIIVAGPDLELIPFAALYDATSRQRLIERVSVAMAPAASVLARRSAAEPHSIVAVPVGDEKDAPLPGSAEELSELARYYRRTVDARGGTFRGLIGAAANADVVHISGHAATGSDAALVFKGPERVSWRRAAGATLTRQPVVVLAACATLRAPESSGTRALSLGAGFLAGGARDVVGTLAPIADNDARVLFGRLHRYLGEGRETAEALRQTQLDSLREEAGGGVHAAWHSVALLTRVIPVRKER